ncbi:hypothetical protein AVEN_248512-1 [Araneus ventricosus]|uniref:Uncharacterized protein n=1 Tax=Araneus ventricosus TaxID=182803 RepID=A0A4Y2E0X9_ARAVE|nr:hypothetical protein AVEN_248512-1 [Araneus ventricosus]
MFVTNRNHFPCRFCHKFNKNHSGYLAFCGLMITSLYCIGMSTSRTLAYRRRVHDKPLHSPNVTVSAFTAHFTVLPFFFGESYIPDSKESLSKRFWKPCRRQG